MRWANRVRRAVLPVLQNNVMVTDGICDRDKSTDLQCPHAVL